MSPRRRGARPAADVFAVAAFAATVGYGPDAAWRPASMVHAKRWGTVLTACGLQATSMHKFWHLPFQYVVSGRCGACAAAIGAAQGRTARSS